jgi:hypothetical protein
MYSDKDIGVPVRARRVQEFSDPDRNPDSDPNRLINLLVGLDSSRTCNTVNEIFQSESDGRSESRYFFVILRFSEYHTLQIFQINWRGR